VVASIVQIFTFPEPGDEYCGIFFATGLVEITRLDGAMLSVCHGGKRLHFQCGCEAMNRDASPLLYGTPRVCECLIKGTMAVIGPSRPAA